MKKGCTISCVGAYQHHMQEMDPAILPRASKIYFDSQEAVLSESGDILLPLEGASLPKTILPVISEISSTEKVSNVYFRRY
ncbi:hypothetical protein [Sporofaciens musculi]|uniref:hypothetical protein n=1 Tax=Sporofaciens musculi TaxID=2681861 RepID=UPI002FE6C8D8